MFDSDDVAGRCGAGDARLGAALAAGPGVAGVTALAGVDPFALDPDDRVLLLQAWERCSRWLAAMQARAVVAVAGAGPVDADDSTRELVRVALLDCGGSAKACVDTARALHGPLAPAWEALAGGAVSWPAVRMLAEETRTLPDPVAAAVTARVLPRAGTGTVAQLRRRVRRAVITADPVAAEQAAQQAARERHVSRHVLPAGQAGLWLSGPAPAVHTVWTALDVHAAATTGTTGDGRSLDTRRFDALVGICTDWLAGQTHEPVNDPTGPPGRAGRAGRHGRAGRRAGSPATVHVFADAPTWAGLADEPVELAGYGPLPAGFARDAFSGAAWRAVITDTLTALPVRVSDHTYRPSARTRRHLLARDRTCTFPGCSAAVWFCDADHAQPHHHGGCTDTDNCGLACRRHHRLKTLHGWTWQRLPSGAVEWQDPNGRRWQQDPIRYQLPPPAD